MRGGDISNDSPRRILVTYDAVTEESVISRKMFGIVSSAKVVRDWSRPALTRLWEAASRLSVRMDLVVLGVDDRAASDLLADLDRRGMHPFQAAIGYENVDELVADLSYRPDVFGVIDIDERSSRYGSAALQTDYLMRLI